VSVAPADAAILHVDLDAFYASVEQHADPSLVGRPVVVGGLGARGVVAAASYEARRFGIQSAMPMARARRACPDAVFLAPRFDAYQDASRAVMAILHSYTPLVEPISLDEAFLDARGARRLHGTGADIGMAIRARVRSDTGLVASVGVATTKMLAKIASDLAKPDGMLTVTPGTELDFLHPLDVSRLWGVGPATRRRLDRLAVRTIADLAALPEPALQRALGHAHGAHLHALAHNIDERGVEPDRQAKSIGHEKTFPTDVTDRARLDRDLTRFAERVATRLRAHATVARTVQIKARYADFRTVTRSRTLREPTDLADDLARVGRELLAELPLGDGLRLLGLSAHQLLAVAELQPALPFDDDDPGAGSRRADLERTIDDVRRRFGDEAVGRAARSAPPRGKPA
jgi:DNA polymerase-4